MARILQASNFNEDWFNESFILWPMQEQYAKQIADTLNKESGENSRYYYRVVENDYKLYIGMEP